MRSRFTSRRFASHRAAADALGSRSGVARRTGSRIATGAAPRVATVPAAAATIAASALLALTIGAAPSLVAAHEFAQDDLLVDHPVAPPTPPGVSSAAGYLTITNDGEEDERLLGGEASFAGDGIELHRTTVEDDVARMRELTEGLLIEAGQSVLLEPGGTHLMFTGLEAPLVDGERLEATLRFERAGEVPVVFAVERPGADAEPMDHEAMGHRAADGEASPEKTGHQAMDHGDANHGAADVGSAGEAETSGDGADRGGMDRGETDDGETTHGGMEHDG